MKFNVTAVVILGLVIAAGGYYLLRPETPEERNRRLGVPERRPGESDREMDMRLTPGKVAEMDAVPGRLMQTVSVTKRG